MAAVAEEEEEAAAEVVVVAEDWDKRGLKVNLLVSPAIALSCGRGNGGWEFGEKILRN